MSKKNNNGASATPSAHLVSEATMMEFCSSLSEDQRLVFANCVLGEVQAAGYTDTRPGSDVWETARRVAVSNIINKEIDLGGLELDVLPYLKDTRDNDDAEAARKANLLKLEKWAEYIREEGIEYVRENTRTVNEDTGYFEDDEPVKLAA